VMEREIALWEQPILMTWVIGKTVSSYTGSLTFWEAFNECIQDILTTAGPLRDTSTFIHSVSRYVPD
jgi:hypothetical protein